MTDKKANPSSASVVATKRATADETGDPFAGAMEEFLSNKEAENPQDALEEKLEDETGTEIKEVADNSPQDALEEKLEDETGTEIKDVTETPEELMDEAEDKAEDKLDQTAESNLNDAISQAEAKAEALSAKKLEALCKSLEQCGYGKMAETITTIANQHSDPFIDACDSISHGLKANVLQLESWARLASASHGHDDVRTYLAKANGHIKDALVELIFAKNAASNVGN